MYALLFLAMAAEPATIKPHKVTATKAGVELLYELPTADTVRFEFWGPQPARVTVVDRKPMRPVNVWNDGGWQAMNVYNQRAVIKATFAADDFDWPTLQLRAKPKALPEDDKRCHRFVHEAMTVKGVCTVDSARDGKPCKVTFRRAFMSSKAFPAAARAVTEVAARNGKAVVFTEYDETEQ